MSCNAKKDPNGTWRIQYRWTDWTGTKKKSQKRGFKTKKEAEEWYAHFMLQQSSDPTMTLADFWEIYKADMEKRLRKTTMKQKEYVMNDKVLPYFGKTPINEITAPMIRKWQGEMIEKGFKPTYLKTIHNQLSAILNYAVNFYDLRSNPCRKAGSMGKSKADERPYWTLEEFQKFSDAIMDKQDSWIGFQILFWTGMRIGDDDDKIRLNQRKPSKYKGLRRFGPEKNLQRINKFMKERPIFYKNLIQMKENIRFYLRCFYCITKVMILQFNSENRTELARNG